MLYVVEMRVTIPHDHPADVVENLKKTERAHARHLQEEGKLRHLWRVVGQYANVSIFDVADNAELHTILSSLPLFPFMTISVRALCRHPSSIRDDDR